MTSVQSNNMVARSTMLRVCAIESGSRRKLLKSCLAEGNVQDICTRDPKRHVCRGGVTQDEPTRNSLMTYQGPRKGEGTPPSRT